MATHRVYRYAHPAVNEITQEISGVTTQWEDKNARIQEDFVSFSDNIPDWKARMKAGLDVTTTMDGVRYDIRPSVGQFTVQAPGFQQYWKQYGDLVSVDIDTSDIEPSVLSQALTGAAISFAKNYRKKTSQWSSGVFCGELLETARMLASPARALRKGVNTLADQLRRNTKLASRKSAKAVKDAIAGTWLEWNFGVKPIISDLDNAATAFRAMASGRTFDTIRINGFAEFAASAPGFPEYQIWSPVAGVPDNGTLYRDVVDVSQVAYRGAWTNENPSGEMPLPMIFESGWKDIIPTAWELVPWSFFVDYFTNIGDVLDTWSMRYVKFAWINRTVRNRRTSTYSDVMAVDSPSIPIYRSAMGGHARHIRSTVSRISIGNTLDVPTDFHVEIPGFDKGKQWLNIAALAALGGKPDWLR